LNPDPKHNPEPIKKVFLPVRTVDKWNRLPEEIQQAATQEDFQKETENFETVIAQKMDSRNTS
jgi:hypothetical protein